MPKFNYPIPILVIAVFAEIAIVLATWVGVKQALLPIVGALLSIVIIYSFAVWAIGEIPLDSSSKSYCWDAVYLTSNQFDRASLSTFQIFCFTLLIIFSLVYILLLKEGELSNIPASMLLLLGIGAGNSVASKTTDAAKNRLSFDHWSWLRQRGWLKVYEEGCSDTGEKRNRQHTKWGDLLKTGPGMDVYKLQMAGFSVVIALAYLIKVLKTGDTSKFEIDSNMLSLLGVSNAVYVGGKIITPNSFGELNSKMGELIAAEKSLVEKVLADPGAIPSPSYDKAKLDELAPKVATQELNAYLVAARAAAVMLQSLFPGKEATRFGDKMANIKDNDLLPQWPLT